MWHVGSDLHRQSLTIAAVHDSGEVATRQRLECTDTPGILAAFEHLKPSGRWWKRQARTGGCTIG